MGYGAGPSGGFGAGRGTGFGAGPSSVYGAGTGAGYGAGLATGGAAVSPLLTDLVGYWTLDEASGTRADSHTNALDLTDNNTVTQAAGAKVGNAAQFTAANSEYLSRASEAAMQPGDFDFTVAAWVYLDTLAASTGLFGKWPGAGNYQSILFCNHTSSRFEFYVSNDGTAVVGVTDTTAVATGGWYFVVGWHDAAANTINIQVNNGTPVSQAHATGVKADGTGPLIMGKNDDGDTHLNGRMDEVGYWHRVLTSDERTALYNGGNGVTYPDFA